MEPKPTAYPLEVSPRIPERLSRLVELAHDLSYSWNRSTRQLFARLDANLWNAIAHSPKVLLRHVSQERLTEAAENPNFIDHYNQVLSAFDTYRSEVARQNGPTLLGPDDLIAYFCAEFGFHESLPVYSGGLGILAGDHCKAASDTHLPFVGVGLLYRQGYFHQTIDAYGRQEAIYQDSDFDDLPVRPATAPDGSEAYVQVEIAERQIKLKVWFAQVGHVRLYLLDTDLPENAERDRDIAHQLYGGDRNVRIAQEIVLGMGGARALAALGLKPSVWHINEGHAAFLVLERVRALMHGGLDFSSALEAVAANTVFTTHTAVAAGHDRFAEQMISYHFDHYCKELRLDKQTLISLGHTPLSHEFNMTTLAVRGSRFQNGVSRIHGGVSARMLSYLWPEVPAEENPVTHITNAVHVPTFLSPDWFDIFDRFLGPTWKNLPEDPEFWKRVDTLPDHVLWGRHQFLKTQMLHLVRYRIRMQHFRNRGSEAHLDRLLKLADPENPNVLTIGFGRRFATYKRATLLFDNLDWLREIISEPKRPVLFIFAGKAHPADEPGQDLIRRIAKIAASREFEGRILLVEGYDLRLARRLVSGVDVWLNNPVFPLEASGTSGMKAGINGVINLSVLDGWWDEGYTGDNGWAIKPASEAVDQPQRDAEEARTLYEILQDQVVPMYYRRNENGYSPEWIRLMKRSIASILPQFNASRMVREYATRFYAPASRQGRNYAADGFANAKAIAAWKQRVAAAWPGVKARMLSAPSRKIFYGERVSVELGVHLNGLGPEDVCAEVLFSPGGFRPGEWKASTLHFTGPVADTGEQRFAAEITPESCGRLEYRVRLFPNHSLLTHRFETGLMLWL